MTQQSIADVVQQSKESLQAWPQWLKDSAAMSNHDIRCENCGEDIRRVGESHGCERPQQTEPKCSCPGWCYFNPGQHHVNCKCKATRHGYIDQAAHEAIAPPAPDDVETLLNDYGAFKEACGDSECMEDDFERAAAAKAKVLAAFARLKKEIETLRKDLHGGPALMHAMRLERNAARDREAALERENEELRFVGAGEAEDNLRLREQLARYQSHCENCREYQIETLREGGPLPAEKERG